MSHQDSGDTLAPLLWRAFVLIGIAALVGTMCSRGVARYEASGRLRVPVAGVEVRELVDTFSDPRGRDRVHHAIDIPASRGTRVVAAAPGTIHRIFSSGSGGLGVYQLDSTRTRCFYYAHLDRYAPGLEEGLELDAGELIGYVGSTGNAPDGTPHLHFEVLALEKTTRCSRSRPINPIRLIR